MLCANNVNAGPYTFTPINFPGASVTLVRGINNAGEVVGYYDQKRGFVRDPNGTFKEISCPDGSSALPTGINNHGDIALECRHGVFILYKGDVAPTPVPNPPAADGIPPLNYIHINDNGALAGC
jgi:hypothetical protein